MKNDELIISALLQGNTIKQTAKICRCSIATVNSRLSDSEFKSRLQAEKLLIIEQSKNKLQYITSKAIETLSELLTDELVPPAVKVSACNSILNNALKYIEICDLMQRVTALEEMRNNENELKKQN